METLTKNDLALIHVELIARLEEISFRDTTARAELTAIINKVGRLFAETEELAGARRFHGMR